MNAREVALAVVRDVFDAERATERGAQEALDYRARKATLNDRDRAFATELAYGAIKMRRALDWYLADFVAGRSTTLPPAIREILRLAVYELVYTKPDVHATVFEFVNLAKKYGHRGLANLTNAVLRRFLRECPPAPARERFTNDDEYLGTRYSLPTWLVRQWRGVFAERTEQICGAVNLPAAAGIVVDSRRQLPQDVARSLAESGVCTVPSDFVPESLVVQGAAGALIACERDAGGAWWMQSESSAMPVDVLNPQAGESVADVCSGRGNKALQIAARLEGGPAVLCVERDARKTAVLCARFERAGLSVEPLLGDATAELLPADRCFDRVLLDAPCSGVGVIGRHAEARWKKEPSDGERLAVTQRAMLERSARHVHPGGALVYAVCSTDPRETTEVIEWFVLRDNFERGLIPTAYEPFLTPSGDVLIPPGIGGRDGFFIARLEHRL